MRSRYRSPLARMGAFAALAALALPAAAGATTVAQPGAATAVREHDGTIVFSELDQASGRWHLAVRRAGAAAAERLSVAASATPFHADVGPDSEGRPELIYQRCGGTTEALTDCELYVFSLADDSGERPVRNANDPENHDVNPTLWRGRIAWTRVYGAGATANPVVYTKTLTAPRSRPSTRLPGVPQSRCGDVDPVCAPTTRREVQALELWGENLALTMIYECRGCAGIFQNELRLDDVGERTARQLVRQVVGLSGQQLIGPSFFDGRLAWYRACLGDESGCRGGAAAPYRYRISSRAYEKGAPGPIRVDGFADTGSRLYEVIGCSEVPEPAANVDCRIDRLAAPQYAATRAP